MNRKMNILAAGTLTGLVLLTILALGFGRLQADAAADPAGIAAPATDNLDAEQALQEWQNYSNELEQTIQTLQERDALYQQQLDAANTTIQQLESQINGNNSATYMDDDDEYEDDDDEEHEYGEHEYEEYDD